MIEHLQFTPEMVTWWQALRELPTRLKQVTVWSPHDHPPQADAQLEQHGTTTLIACLQGSLRTEGVADRCDLGAGEVLLLRPGTWHRHLPLRAGSVSFAQGSIAGRSDFFLDAADVHLVSSVPTEPSLGLMERAARTTATEQRLRLVAELITNTVRETATPLASAHPALLRMEYALWQNLHRHDALAQMITASGLGRAQAFRLCRKHWKLGPAAMLRRERLRLARELLDDAVPVGEVATRCGFASRRVFTRAYGEEFGQPPSTVASSTAR
jgi:AraC-like DNA-binding protein